MPKTDPEIFSSALASLDLDSLVAFVREFHRDLPRERQAELVESLARFAARLGWRPQVSPQIEEVRSFVNRARARRMAEPFEYDEAFRQGLLASMAGDHETARLIFELLWAPLLACEIDVGAEELFSDVLSTDLDECARRYLLAIYLTSPMEERAAYLFRQLVELRDEIWGSQPLAGLEAICPLPDLEIFLPLWHAMLLDSQAAYGFRRPWLDEAVARWGGSGGLG